MLLPRVLCLQGHFQHSKWLSEPWIAAEQPHIILVWEAALYLCKLRQENFCRLPDFWMLPIIERSSHIFFTDRLFSRLNNKIHSVDMKKLIIKLWICFPLPKATITDLSRQMCVCVCTCREGIESHTCCCSVPIDSVYAFCEEANLKVLKNW